MSQERWDVVLRFLEGPLTFQGDLVCRGPVVRMGANPGPGGLKLEGYRALDDRQAVIQSYDGGTVSVAPVGTNQVRVAPHENVDWNEIPPIRGPVYLSNGAAFHLGPPGRGCTAIFIESRRLGVWEQRQLLSEAQQVEGEGSDVKELDVQRGRPPWFIPSMVMIGLAISVGVLIQAIKPPPIPPLGPVAEGVEYYEFVDIATEPVDPRLKDGFKQAFNDFVMKPNAAAAEWPELTNIKQWDDKFLTYVTRSAEYHSRAWKFWQRLEEIHDEYAYVVSQVRDAGLPEVFAAIPYQESTYRAQAQSYVCAKGYWQFMPEVANRMKLGVSGCKLSGSAELWTPTALVIPNEANRVYYAPNPGSIGSCRIQSCQVDERTDLQASTRAALEMLKEPMTDPELMQSGAVVQMAILSHNMGYDDGRFAKGRVSGVRNAWRRYADAKKVTRAPEFYGANILCTDPSAPPNEKCGSTLWKETQHYAYNIVAQHILAVCYYARNYGSDPAFDAWRAYDRGDGYCSNVQVPESEKVKAHVGGAK